MAEKKVKTSVSADKQEAKKSVSPKTDKFAVIKTGGKQYVVSEGRFYDFEKINVEEGADAIFEEVLLVANGSEVKVGAPKVEGVKVVGKVLSQFKDDKVVVFKYKPKKRYRKTQGHRQQKTRVEITKIS